jgi:predicted nucleic acid-binding protein
MPCADTSFLFSLYHRDAHTGESIARLGRAAQPLALSALNEYELFNAFRLAEFRGLLPTGEAARRLDAFREDQAAGRWHHSDVALKDILAEAARLSLAHTASGGHRAFDILHVAHASLAKPKLFLSFDAKQLALAKAVGLRCG